MMPDYSTIPTRNTPFGYICGRCCRCCQHKHIQVDPYEVARLARARGETTTQFRGRWTVDGQGTTLRQKEDGTCVFLGPQGCEVYADRPLVCRLYPLGRHFRKDGFEYFSISAGHPQTAGEYNKNGTIADYLEAKGAKPFIIAGDAYFRWFCDAYKKIGVTDDALISEFINGADDQDLLDMDGMIAKHCAANGGLEPESIEDRQRLHLKLLYDVLENLEGNNDQGSSKTNAPVA
jgi:Fe-S-cluster containining protein